MSSRKLLVLDDDPHVATLIGRVASRAGYAATVTTDYEGFTSAYDDDTAVVVLDLVMPGKDGVEVIRFLAARRSRAGLILSSAVEPRVLRTARQLAIDRGLRVIGSLAKPFDIDRLTELLGAVGPDSPIPDQLPPAEVLEDDLRQALETGDLSVLYQPKVHFGGHRTAGVEAMVRWQHPDLGLLGPNAFVGLAEKAGLAWSLSRVVMQRAFARGAEWTREGLDVSVAVNLSTSSLNDLGLPDQIQELAEDAGLATEKIILEVTESWLTEDVLTAVDILTRFRLKGLELSIDDFGTGHSHLQQLKRFPFSELKLDQAFVRGADEDQEARTIAESSIGLAHALELRVVAEGIETQPDWDLMARLGCDLAQGYHVAPPMPGHEVSDWIGLWSSRPD